MASPPFSLWLFIGFAALAYLAVPPFLKALKIQLPSTFEQLGEPSFGTIFSRDPNNWGMQFRFLAFVLSGQAVLQTRGNTKILASLALVAYLGTLVSLALLIYAILGIAKH